MIKLCACGQITGYRNHCGRETVPQINHTVPHRKISRKVKRQITAELTLVQEAANAKAKAERRAA